MATNTTAGTAQAIYALYVDERGTAVGYEVIDAAKHARSILMLESEPPEDPPTLRLEALRVCCRPGVCWQC